MTEMLPQLLAVRRTGDEQFVLDGVSQGFDLGTFWSWSSSDLVSNATRGVLAEYLVARCLGAIGANDVRAEWDAYDLTTPDGVKVEVKSAAYVQSWAQKDYSRPSFSIGPAKGWDPSTGETAPEPERAADVYVFALLAHREQETINPLELSQWEFYVAATHELEEQFGPQRSLGIRALQAMSEPVSFRELASAVEAAGQ